MAIIAGLLWATISVGYLYLARKNPESSRANTYFWTFYFTGIASALAMSSGANIFMVVMKSAQYQFLILLPYAIIYFGLLIAIFMVFDRKYSQKRV